MDRFGSRRLVWNASTASERDSRCFEPHRLRKGPPFCRHGGRRSRRRPCLSSRPRHIPVPLDPHGDRTASSSKLRSWLRSFRCLRRHFFCPFGGPSLRASHSWRVVRCRESPQARESTTPAMRIRAIRRPARSAATNAPSPRWLRSSPRPLRPAFQTKPRPPSPRRTPYPGGMAQVAHGCATALRKDRMSSRRVGHTARVRRPLPELGLSHRLKGPVWS